jgi:hypothetical protein
MAAPKGRCEPVANRARCGVVAVATGATTEVEGATGEAPTAPGEAGLNALLGGFPGGGVGFRVCTPVSDAAEPRRGGVAGPALGASLCTAKKVQRLGVVRLRMHV